AQAPVIGGSPPTGRSTTVISAAAVRATAADTTTTAAVEGPRSGCSSATPRWNSGCGAGTSSGTIEVSSTAKRMWNGKSLVSSTIQSGTSSSRRNTGTFAAVAATTASTCHATTGPLARPAGAPSGNSSPTTPAARHQPATTAAPARRSQRPGHSASWYQASSASPPANSARVGAGRPGAGQTT